MLNWLFKRLREPTTFIGAGLLTQAIMLITKADPVHTEVVSNVFEQVATPLSTGDYTTAATIGIAGLLGVLMGEKAK